MTSVLAQYYVDEDLLTMIQINVKIEGVWAKLDLFNRPFVKTIMVENSKSLVK